MEVTPTRAIARFIAGLTFEKIPPKIVDDMKKYILDTIGCGIFGSTLPWCKTVVDVVKGWSEKNEATIWGTNIMVSCPNAALANGMMTHGFDFDDFTQNSGLHVGSAAVPPALAIAEWEEGVTGRDFLTAVTAGYEAAIRIGLCVGTSPLARGWHIAGFNGTFAAAAASSKILALDEDKIMHALGIGGTQGAGLMAAQYGADVKRFHMGRAAQSGAIGAILARAGLSGITNILEAEYGGYCATIAPDTYDLSKITRDLGRKYVIPDRVNLKVYPGIAIIHTGAEATKVIMDEHAVKQDMIKRIIVKVNKLSLDHVGFKYEPVSIMWAEASMQYAVALMALDGQLGVDQFSEEKIRDPNVYEFTKKVDVVLSDELERRAPYSMEAQVEILLKDGRAFSHTVEFPRGAPQRGGLTKEEVVDKFKSLVTRVLGNEKTGAIIEAIDNLEEMDNISTLAKSLRP